MQSQTHDDIEVFALIINDQVDSSTFDQLLHLFDEEIQKRVLRLRHREDRLRSLLGRVLISWVFRQKGLLKTGIPKYNYGQNSKPFIENEDNIQFNLSHSGRWVVCAISTDAVGIDVEFRKSLQMEDMVDILSKEEKSLLHATQSTEVTSLFYDIWTTKESYLKALGEGLNETTSLSHLSRSVVNSQIELRENGNLIEDWFFSKIEIDQDYSLTLCGRSKNNKNEVTFVDIGDIIRDTLRSQ